MAEQKNTEPADERDPRSAAYGAAVKRLREGHRDEFNAMVAEEMKARGVDWRPRLTPEEKAAKQIKQLLAEHPDLAAQFSEKQ